jgi:hypothetical protein
MCVLNNMLVVKLSVCFFKHHTWENMYACMQCDLCRLLKSSATDVYRQ